MPNWRLAFCLCFACLVCVPAYAGTPGGDASLSGGGIETKPLLRIDIAGGSLSVELADAEIGDVMKAIAAKSGIKVEISGGVYGKKVTTSFRGLDLERGIARLLSLVQEKNYMIRYNAAGSVSKVEIYGSGAAPSASAGPKAAAPSERHSVPAAPVPAARMPRIRKNPPASSRILPPFGEKETVRRKPRQDDEAADNGDQGEEAPAESSEKIPAYIPPHAPRD